MYRDPVTGWEGGRRGRQDRTAAILGNRLGADTLLVLTNVSGRSSRVGDGSGDARSSDDGCPMPSRCWKPAELPAGSMAPKLEAAVSFIQQGGRRAVIAHLAEGVSALGGEAGTTILGDNE